MERQVGLARGSAGDLHERLCPLLQDIARDRLATAGIDLDRDPETAEAALGPEAWELVRADRPPPGDRHGRGATLPDIQSAVASIEQIGAAR